MMAARPMRRRPKRPPVLLPVEQPPSALPDGSLPVGSSPPDGGSSPPEPEPEPPPGGCACCGVCAMGSTERNAESFFAGFIIVVAFLPEVAKICRYASLFPFMPTYGFGIIVEKEWLRPWLPGLLPR